MTPWTRGGPLGYVGSMEIHTEARVDVHCPRSEVFALATATANLPRFFRGRGPVPAIERAEMLDGATPAAGAVRRIHNSDGSAVDEEIRAFEPGRRHTYRLVRGIRFPFSALVRWGEGDWTFDDLPEGTRVVWRYRFALTTPLVYPLAAAVIHGFFQRAMQDALERLRDAAG